MKESILVAKFEMIYSDNFVKIYGPEKIVFHTLFDPVPVSESDY
jgi:hypothetical protein